MAQITQTFHIKVFFLLKGQKKLWLKLARLTQTLTDSDRVTHFWLCSLEVCEEHDG